MTSRIASRASRASCRAGFTHLDLLVLLILLPFMAVMVLAAAESNQDPQKKCADNLRQIGQAWLMYGQENKGMFPRTYFLPGSPLTDAVASGTPGRGAFASSDPFRGDNPVGTNNITAAVFLLMRTQMITSNEFICPATNKVHDEFGGGSNNASHRSNFSDKERCLAYSFANPYPDRSAISAGHRLNVFALRPELAIGADLNPGLKGESAVPAKLTAASDVARMRAGNSPNHGRAGQNVLYGDGHVAFMNNPLVGVQRDNIYVNAKGRIDASPVNGNDSLLLPTAE